MQTITGAPRTFSGKVIIGNAGADSAPAAMSQPMMRPRQPSLALYATPGSPDDNKGDPAMERAAATWTGEYWKTGTGGAVWDSITFDTELNRIYSAPAMPARTIPRSAAPAAATISTPPRSWRSTPIPANMSGTTRSIPRDSWDFDCTQRMTLAELKSMAKRKVLMQAPKNGFFYVLDRETESRSPPEKIGKATWADHIDLATGRPVEANNIRYENGRPPSGRARGRT